MGIRGIGGPNFSGGPVGPQNNGRVPANSHQYVPAINNGPKFGDEVSFSGGLPAAQTSLTHNVNFQEISKLSLPDAGKQLHPTTFGALTNLF
jgi:hypothetical protein